MRLNSTLFALAGVLSLAALTGCVDADPSFVLKGAIVGELSDDDGLSCARTCTFTSGGNATRVNTAGVLDLARLEQSGQFPYLIPGSYVVNLELTNTLAQSDANDGSRLRNDTNSISLREFIIVWKTPDGETLYEPGEADSGGSRPAFALVDSDGGILNLDVELLSGTIFPNGTNSEAAFLRGAISQDITQSPKQVIVEIQARGETLDGQNVESQIMKYPISICDGCNVFDRVNLSCCNDPAAASVPGFDGTPGCPVFGATPMCVLAE